MQKDIHIDKNTFKNKLLQSGFSFDSYNLSILILSSLVINIFSLAVPLVTLQVYDRILAFNSIDTLQVLVSGVVIVIVLDAFLKISRSSLIGWTSARFEHAAFTNVLSHLLFTKISALKNFSSGEQLHRISSIAKLKTFYSGQSLVSLIDLPFVIIFLGFIAYLSGALVLVPIVLLIAFALYASYLGKKMKRALLAKDADDDKRINFISEILDHVHTVKMLGLEQVFQRRYEGLLGHNIGDSYELNGLSAQGYNAASLFTQIMMVSMISLGALFVLNGSMTMGVLIACVLLSGRIMQPVQRALSFWVGFQEYQLAKSKIDELLSIEEQETLPLDELTVPKGKLEAQNISYINSDQEFVFKDQSLKIPNGKAVALIGTSNDDNTTLMKLMAGLYEPSNGQLLVDGHNVHKIPKGKLTKYVGYLPSDSDIFYGTILENLTGFRPELEDQAIEIAKYLGIDKVVSKLAAGYQTQLFDGPADPITPGMKQRITIARVLVNKPRILLFDHADKSLDKDGYNHLFKLLGQLKGQATMVLCSNDRNILHLAQEEYLLDNGQIKLNEGQIMKSGDIARPLKELQE